MCKLCLDVCPTSAIIHAPDGTISVEFQDGEHSWFTEGYVRIDTNSCINCKQCIPVCPYGAIYDTWPAINGGYPAPWDGSGSGGSGSTVGGPGGNNPGSSVSSHFVASGQGTSAYDVAGLMLAAFGLSASHAEIAATAANLEATAMSGFKTASRIFGVIDIASNVIEFAQDPNWEDAGQAVLGIALTFGAMNPATAIVGGIILAAWELYEYKRDH
ncbi:DUF362 domain-containing protein [Pedobacter chinensis]|uniref:DUF362 domain-containing protein n=1 Tax=Pedobacter chinensis TaxID=2282421 RepID=UPI0013147629|nr:4Fe-4S binding protein [Pedobacter chinensis]